MILLGGREHGTHYLDDEWVGCNENAMVNKQERVELLEKENMNAEQVGRSLVNE